MKKNYWFLASIAFGISTVFGGMSHPFDNPDAFQQYQYKTQDTHYILGAAIDGRCIELEDRTTWRVPNSATYIISQWKKGDPIFIIPTTCTFFSSDYPYTMKNLRTHTQINTTMETCPDRDGPYTKFVRTIDRYNRRVILVNHYGATFTFDIHPSDMASLDDWELKDRIFVASNKEFWSSNPSHRMLLVNSETLSQARARE